MSIAREFDDAARAVLLARRYFHADRAEADEIDLQLWRLLKQGSITLRAEMAHRLSHVPAGPTRTLRALACDADPEVAGPVLRYSPAICNVAIAEMARCKGDGHLEAIAARKHLNAKISGIVARRGGPQVLKVLLQNKTAKFTGEGRHRLERRLRQAAHSAERSRLRQGRAGLAHSSFSAPRV